MSAVTFSKNQVWTRVRQGLTLEVALFVCGASPAAANRWAHRERAGGEQVLERSQVAADHLLCRIHNGFNTDCAEQALSVSVL